ncbi:MAG: hypothetical protein V4492_03310 [Chlamydiota bacterium]
MRLKTVFSCLCCIALAILAARFCHHQTRGFRLSKITENTALLPTGAVAESCPASIDSLLHQKFHYFARGKQSFAFLSEDGEYVLKIFNNTYQRKIRAFHLLSHLPWIGNWAKEKELYFQSKLSRTFQSYHIAMNQMQEKSGLYYAHLFSSHSLPEKLTLIDPLHIEHTLNPNTLGFLIQKRVQLVYPSLKSWIDEDKWEEAQAALHSLMELFFWKFRNGIADNDPLIRTNYGFAGTKACQIDVGPLSQDDSLKKIEHQKEEITRISSSLKKWLNENGPQLIPFLDRELEDQLSSGHETSL